MCCLRLGIIKIAQVEFQMLTNSTNSSNGTHASQSQQVEVAVCEYLFNGNNCRTSAKF